MASYNGRYLALRLETEGYKTNLIFFGSAGLSLSTPTPIGRLRSEIKHGDISAKRIEELVSSQIKLGQDDGRIPKNPKEAQEKLNKLRNII